MMTDANADADADAVAAGAYVDTSSCNRVLNTSELLIVPWNMHFSCEK